MLRRLGLLLLCCLGIAAVQADENENTMAFTMMGSDRFMAGQEVLHAQQGIDDLFMAGEVLTSDAAISGSAHMAGRRLSVTAPVARDAYMAGEVLRISAPIDGDLSMAGRVLTLEADVGGDVRAAGADINLGGNIGGYASLAGESVTLEGQVSGDVWLGVETVSFGDGARIDGVLYAPETLTLPEPVPAARVERLAVEEFEQARPAEPKTLEAQLRAWQRPALVALGILAVFCLLLPRLWRRWQAPMEYTPWRSLWFGFLMLSLLLGASLLIIITLVGALLTPLIWLAFVVWAVLGYFLAASALGNLLWQMFGSDWPEHRIGLLFAGVIGLGVAALLTQVPWVGIPLSIALMFWGAGSLAIAIFRPVFGSVHQAYD